MVRGSQLGLGEEFLAAVRAILESMVANPERFPVVYRQTRRALLRRFPYGLYYRIVDDQIVVLAACMVGETHGGGNLVDDRIPPLEPILNLNLSGRLFCTGSAAWR